MTIYEQNLKVFHYLYQIRLSWLSLLITQFLLFYNPCQAKFPRM